ISAYGDTPHRDSWQVELLLRHFQAPVHTETRPALFPELREHQYVPPHLARSAPPHHLLGMLLYTSLGRLQFRPSQVETEVRADCQTLRCSLHLKPWSIRDSLHEPRQQFFFPLLPAQVESQGLALLNRCSPESRYQ